MPWTPAQKRLFGAKYRRGELSKAQFDKMMHEPTRKDVSASGHAVTSRLKARKKKMKRTVKRSQKMRKR
jgi:hypothetical protein